MSPSLLSFVDAEVEVDALLVDVDTDVEVLVEALTEALVEALTEALVDALLVEVLTDKEADVLESSFETPVEVVTVVTLQPASERVSAAAMARARNFFFIIESSYRLLPEASEVPTSASISSEVIPWNLTLYILLSDAFTRSIETTPL